MGMLWQKDIWPRLRFAAASALAIVFLLLMGAVYYAAIRPVRRWWPGGIYWWGLRYIWILRLLAGARVRTTVAPEVDLARPYVYASNHLSYLDIAAVMTSIPIWWRFVATSRLRRVPIFGPVMNDLGQVFLDTRDRARAAASMEEAARRVREGQSILVYPEGRISRTGELLPFRRGAFVLAIRTGVPIVPVLMRGTKEVLDVHTFRSRPGTVYCDLLAPVPTDGYDVQDADRLAAAVRERLAAAQRELAEAARGAATNNLPSGKEGR